MSENKQAFSQFREYCLKAQNSLNQLEGYQVCYRVVQHQFAKDHDAQYLQIRYLEQEKVIKMNICYSLAYQIPVFYFMVYDENSQPLSVSRIYEQYFNKGNGGVEELDPQNVEKGIYLSQNPITRQYFYTLHHCQMKMKLNYLIPFYLSLLRLNPPIVIDAF